MGWLSSIFGLLGKLADIYINWRKKKDLPATQRDAREKSIDKDIANADSVGATLHGSDDLDKLERLRNRKLEK